MCLYLMIDTSMISEKLKVTRLAAMIGMSLTRKPYISHNKTPTVNMMYIGRDRLWVSLVRNTFTAWGMNAAVVHAAAVNPMMVKPFMLRGNHSTI